jgi:hypothetical protein
MADEGEDYYVPLEDQRVFGAGIKRKRIAFVPASNTEAAHNTGASPPAISTTNIADRYLSIVLSKSVKTNTSPYTDPSLSASLPPPPPPPDTASAPLCSVCSQPLSPTHESTIAHQLCLAHSHPPSHLDRSRAGLRYLNSYGWDPDSRVGLGANAEGRRYPIKPIPKHDTVGLRERDDLEAELAKVKVRKEKKQEGVVKKMNAKEVRRKDDEMKKKAERLRGMFYRNDEVEKYLGEAG